MMNCFTLAGRLAKIKVIKLPDTGTHKADVTVEMQHPIGVISKLTISMFGDNADKTIELFEEGTLALISGRLDLITKNTCSPAVYSVRLTGTSIELLKHENHNISFLEFTDNQEMVLN